MIRLEVTKQVFKLHKNGKSTGWESKSLAYSDIVCVIESEKIEEINKGLSLILGLEDLRPETMTSGDLIYRKTYIVNDKNEEAINADFDRWEEEENFNLYEICKELRFYDLSKKEISFQEVVTKIKNKS